MIKKLRRRIFLIIMILLSIVTLGIIILFTILNYNNTINATTLMMDRVVNEMQKKNPNDKIGDTKLKSNINIDGLYYVLIEDSNIVAQNFEDSNDNMIKEYAIKLAEKGNEKGIIGKYIYKVKKFKDNTVSVILMENENVILHIKRVLIFSIGISIIAIITIYIIAKRFSTFIVNPVQETFEKQKQFISDASHELKTPLAVIEANTDVLENEIGDNKWMDYIQNEIDSMNKLINELLLLAKIENVDDINEYKQFDISKEIEIIVSMFESMAYEKKVTIKCNIQENITMNGTKEDIEHIVSTLIDNAIKHTESKNEVIVELKKEKNEVILQIKNKGKPIPEEERGKIFERFYRIDKSRNRNEKRYGLGLSIAKSTVEKYKGKIEVYYKNGYTIFKVTIPN